MSKLPSPYRPSASTTRLALGLLLALPLISYALATLSSASIDLAHHYALVVRLSEFWSLPNTADPSLGEMNFYPALSHAMAAMLGRIVDSPLLGMQLLAEIAVYLVWTAIAAMVLALPRRSAYLTAATLLVLIFLNRKFGHFFLHGDEIVESYFFPQIVAQACAICTLLAMLCMEKNHIATHWRQLLLSVAIYVTCSVHLLPASELLGFFAAAVALDVYMGGWPRRRANYVRMGASVALLAVASVAFLRNPAYTAMKSISANDGGLSIPHLSSLPAIVGFSVAVMALSLGLVYAWIRLARDGRGEEWIALKYIALYGVAVTGLCIAQYLALQAGQGSPYAVKKHLFAVATALLIELSVLPALLRSLHPSRQAPAAGTTDGAVLDAVLLPALAALAFLATIAHAPAINMASVLAVEKRLELLHASLLADVERKNVYLSGLSDLPPTFDYMFSIGTFRTPRTAAFHLLEPIGSFDFDGVLIAGTASPLARLACRLPTSAYGFAVMDGHCVNAALTTARPDIGLTAGSAPSPCKLAGFSSAEDNGTWTDGAVATLICPVPTNNGQPYRNVQLSASAFLAGSLKSQRVLLSVDGGQAVEYVYDQQHNPQQMHIAIDHPTAASITIRLGMPDAAAPSALLDSGDGRKLGIMVRGVEFK